MCVQNKKLMSYNEPNYLSVYVNNKDDFVIPYSTSRLTAKRQPNIYNNILTTVR